VASELLGTKTKKSKYKYIYIYIFIKLEIITYFKNIYGLKNM